MNLKDTPMIKSSPSTGAERAKEVTIESKTCGDIDAAVQKAPPATADTALETTTSENHRAKIFLSFNYPELKDLGKHFLTLSSATAVFLLTFIDKLTGTKALFNQSLKACMALLLLAIAAAGCGLFFNYIAGAGASGAVIWGIGKKRFRAFTIATYILYMLAGSALFLAYALLAYAALYR